MELIQITLFTIWGVIENWWWVPLPFILYRPFLYFWLYWRRERWMQAQKIILLEIKMPKEVLKPLRAMEQVFSSFWGNIFDPPDWWETWIDGKQLDSVQLEIASLNGESHFYIRLNENRRRAIESSVYSQYADAEISIVDDYTKYVSQDLPNKDWDIWGTDFELIKPDVFPIKTYPKFFEEKPEASKEEKRIDPMATLLEGMGTLGPGEQLWIQIAIKSVTSSKKDFKDFKKEGREIADRLAKRPEKSKPRPVVFEAAETLIAGKVPGEEEKKEEPIIPPEMKLTPGERDVVAGVEGKIAKRCFESYMRFIYLAKRDAYFGGAKAVPFGFFQQFSTENLNAPKPWTKTITKIHKKPIPFFNMLRPRRLFIRKRKIFRNYIKRISPLFPRCGGTFIFDTEELATIFHFPGRIAAPAPFVPRVEAKRGEAPSGLPMEE